MARHLATRWTGGGVGAFRVGSEARAAERVETRQGLGVGECLAADRTLGQVAQKTPETVVAVSVRHHADCTKHNCTFTLKLPSAVAD